MTKEQYYQLCDSVPIDKKAVSVHDSLSGLSTDGLIYVLGGLLTHLRIKLNIPEEDMDTISSAGVILEDWNYKRNYQNTENN